MSMPMLMPMSMPMLIWGVAYVVEADADGSMSVKSPTYVDVVTMLISMGGSILRMPMPMPMPMSLSTYVELWRCQSRCRWMSKYVNFVTDVDVVADACRCLPMLLTSYANVEVGVEGMLLLDSAGKEK
jgi:hypothetical protein